MQRLRALFLLCLSMWLCICTSACAGRGTPQPTGAPAPAHAVLDISGPYAVNGIDPTGVEYSGRLQIDPASQPGQYDLQWIITGSLQEGQGVLQGNQLAVTWRTVAGFDRPIQGTALYTVTVNGELYGIRTVEGIDASGTETAYPNTPENMR